METLLKDIKAGGRALLKEPGSAALSVVILALGIGLTTFMFSILYGVFFRGLDIPEAERVVMVWEVDTRSDDPQRGTTSVPSQDFHDFRERLTAFSGLLGYWGGTVNLAGDEFPERYQGAFVTANTFDVLQVQPVLGRTFAVGEDQPGLPPTVLLGYHVWRDRYGSDPGVVGRSVRVNGEQGTIVGVMPEGFKWPSNHDVWVTMDDDPTASDRREGRYYQTMGRLAPGVSWDQASADVARVAAQLQQEHPEANEHISARIDTVVASQTGEELRLIFTAMMIAALCVLLVACANVANLLLARAATRVREAAVRVALGAGRLRVMLPFFAEALVLAVAGAVLGVGLAYWAVGLFDAVTAGDVTGRPYFIVFQVDGPILLWVLGVTLLTALAAGVAPAFQMSRTDVNSVLKDEARGSSSLSLGRLTRGLVVVEVALSCALLIGAGLMGKSILTVKNYELPFDRDAYMGGRIGLFETDYPEEADRQRFWRELEDRLAAMPGVADAALTSSLPGTSAGGTRIRLEGEVYDEPQDRPLVHVEVVTPAYFSALDVRPLRGEGLGLHHTDDVERVAVVNESFEARFWPGGSAVGRRFRTGTADTIPWIRIVGVVPDLQMEGFQPPGSPAAVPEGYYVPLAQADSRFLSVLLRPTSGAPMALAPGLRDVVRALDANLPVYDVKSLDQSLHEESWFYSVFGSIFIVFGAAALFMASAGLYGVLAFSVRRRTQEMGIRMALGAGGREVVRLVLRQGVIQIGVGLALGLVTAWGVSTMVSLLMYQVNPRDPLIFGGVVATILLVGVLASVVPAHRATRVDPMVALRSE